MAEFKPCPFCGSEDVEICQIHELYAVFCYSCHAKSCECSTVEKAVEAWNRRAKKGDREPSMPLLARISYLFGEIVNLNEEIANLRNEVARLTSENIGYREKQSFTKKFGAKGD